MKTYMYHFIAAAFFLIMNLNAPAQSSNSLLIVGLAEGPSNGIKTTEFYALKDIPDLSVFAVGTANNGGGTDSIEYNFPAVAITAGSSFFLARDSAEFRAFWGFDADFIEPSDNPANTFNGDDAYELFENGMVVDVFGEINVDGTGLPWEYTDGWAKRINGTGPDDTTFVLSNWSYSGINVFDGVTMNEASSNPYPLEPYSTTPEPSNSLIIVGLAEGPSNGIKITEFYALKDIPDLSVFAVGSANNGGGSDSIEYNFPATAIAAGSSFFLARDSAEFHDFFGFSADFIEDDVDPTANTFNGDDAYELFERGVVVDVFGEIDVDGTDQPWEYTDGWAKRKNGTGPDGSTFILDNWTISALDVFDGVTTNDSASTPYPLAPYLPTVSLSNSLILVGLAEGPTNGTKITEFYVVNDISDLSVYGVGTANNGGGSNGIEYTFPAVAVTAGTNLFLARDSTEFHDFYGFPADFIEDMDDPTANSFNGDDAYEVFENGEVIDVFGDINMDGTGEPWEYTDGWAHRKSSTGPDGSVFILDNWEFSALDVFDGVTVNDSSSQPYPLGTFTLDPCFGSSAIVITEIMYNSPGADIEFLELYNASNDAIDMTGYTLDGVVYTFPSLSLAAGEYLIISDDSVRMFSVFGSASLQWASGSLSNNGEKITLFDADGNTVDCVDYGTADPWSLSADGHGPSLILCDPTSENFDGTNWQRATTATGVFVDGTQLFANPGVGAACSSDPIIAFGESNRTVGEAADTLTIPVFIDNAASVETMVDIRLTSGGNADIDSDFIFSDATLTFAASNNAEQTIQIVILDDTDVEDSETVTLELSNATNTANIITNLTTVRIIDNDSELSNDLILVGVYPGPITALKSSEFYAVNDIPDLSIYGVGSANNGGGSDGIEYRFPAISVNAGTCFYLTRDQARFAQFFGMTADFEDNGSTVANSFNGDDAYELFQNEKVVDVFGEIDADGSGTAWEYTFGWAHRKDDTGPDGVTFDINNWNFSGLNVYTSDDQSNEDATNPYPIEQCLNSAIHLVDFSEDIAVYPNPAGNEIYIESNIDLQAIHIVNLLGQRILSDIHPAKASRLNLQNLASDIYLMQFIVGDQMWVQKIIIQK